MDPLHWKKPRHIFVNSMSDLLHEGLPLLDLERVFRVMLSAPWHSYQILTKRAERLPGTVTTIMNRIFGSHWRMPDCIWLGVSVENFETKHRIDRLRETPAALRFLSIEPLLQDIGRLDLGGISWVIVGGESGPGARPMHPGWVRNVRDQCHSAGVAFFFKQWGEYGPWIDHQMPYDSPRRIYIAGDGTVKKLGESNNGLDLRDFTIMERVGKKASGRLLDGREWNEFPQPARAEGIARP